MMQICRLSAKYTVRQLNEADIDAVFDLCSKNKLFYQFHPPFVTKDSILEEK